MKESTMSKTTNKQSIASMTGATELLPILGTIPDFEEYDMTDGERTMLQSLLQEAAQCRLNREQPYPKEWAHLVSRRQYEYATKLLYREAVEALRSFTETMRRKDNG